MYLYSMSTRRSRSRSDAIQKAYRNFSNFVLSLPENANHVAANAVRRFSRSSRNDGRVVPINFNPLNRNGGGTRKRRRRKRKGGRG